MKPQSGNQQSIHPVTSDDRPNSKAARVAYGYFLVCLLSGMVLIVWELLSLMHGPNG